MIQRTSPVPLRVGLRDYSGHTREEQNYLKCKSFGTQGYNHIETASKRFTVFWCHIGRFGEMKKIMNAKMKGFRKSFAKVLQFTHHA